ncbi:hypothetical protein [uncultured Clostridium sp.]|uniref:hypothetical protein n=1 Tax=uncultured Clostridium sp. TaxID=59620 RepID=UPI0026013444|nr:hypothetical protein [uncultured Clostridium sp.]
MYRNVKISVIEVVGKTDILFDNINSLDENDLFGCAIDKKSAYDLFGSYNVIGKQINYNSDKYIIRSTFESPKNTLIINMKSNSLTTLNTVTVVRDHGTTDKNIKDLLLTKYGIAGELIDYNFISDLFKISLLFIMIFLCFYIFKLHKTIVENIKLKYKNISFINILDYKNFTKKDLFIYIFSKIILFVSIFIIFIFIKNHFSLLGDYIPNKWSNFEFWRDLFEQKIDAVNMLIKIQKTNYDIIYVKAFFKSIFYSILSLLVFLKISNNLTKKN